MPNMIETAIAMLAATSIGAVWASCATDIGLGAAVDRFGQIKPKVLFAVDGYFYKGKAFNSLSNIAEIVKGIPSIEKVVVASYIGEKPDISHIPRSIHYDDFLSKKKGLEIQFE
jgi:acetoacetyl-CoA synthetase